MAPRAKPEAPADQSEGWENRVVGSAIAPTVDPDDTAEMEIGDRLRVAFSQAPGDRTRVALYRRHPESKARQWCAEYTSDQFDEGGMELIRRDWGPGTYEIRAFGSRGLLMRANFEIASVPVKAQEPDRNDALSRVLQSMADTQAAILARLANPTPVSSPMEDMQKMLALAAGMRDAFGMNQTAHAPAQQSSTAVLSELMGAMKALKELSTEVNPPASDPENPLSMVQPIISLIREGMAAKRGEPVEIPTIATPPSMSAETASPINESNEQMKALIMKGIAEKIIGMATAGDSAEKGGQFIYESLPDEFLPFLTLPNWFDLLANAMPALVPHRAWLEAAKLEADKLFAAESSDPG